MTDSTRYGNPAEFDVDLHSIYAAYLGDFDSQNIDWWDASWGGYFRSFNDFLGFGWDGMVVVDSITGRAHIGARREQITLFARMIKTRFGETLDKEPPSVLPLSPAPARSRTLHRLVHMTDIQAYRKLSSTLAPAELSHLRARVRAGEPGVIGALFHAGSPEPDAYAASAGVRTNGQGYTWACIKTTWWDKGGPPQGYVPGHGRTVMAKPGQGGKALILEMGLAALRCANLRAVDVWPPVPDKNYRKSHYVIEEWVDKRTNTERPNYPRAYGFGRSAFVSEKSVERIVDASLGALASHDVEGGANTLVLLSCGDPQPIPLPASTTLSPTILQLDVLQLEYALLQQAQRQGVPGVGERRQPLASLRQLLHHLQIPVAPHAPLGNAGNEAFYTVLAFQKLLMRDTRLPDQLFAGQAFASQAFAQPDFYAQQSMYGAPAFAPYAGLPMPPPLRADARKNSSPSLHRVSLPSAELELPSFPAPLSRQHTGESGFQPARTRPATVAVGSSNDIRDELATQSTARQPGRNSGMPRSQTVYWDDGDYSDAGRSRPRFQGNGNGTTPSSPDQKPARGNGSVPPSSLRHSQVFSGNSSMANSRSVSFHDDRRPPTIRSQGSSSGQSKESNSAIGSRTNSGTALGPSGLSALQGSASGGSGGSGSGSASSGLASDASSTKLSPEATAVPEKNVRKMKSERSVKHLAGALTKFWVD